MFHSAFLSAFGAITLVLATLSAPVSAQPSEPIRVASKGFTESIVIAEMMAEVLEAAGMKVDRKLGLGGTGVIHQALINGEIDTYPEYTGTALLVQLKLPVNNDPSQVYETVKGEYAKRWDLVWLQPLGFNDTYALAMRRPDAQKQSIKSISDLAAKAAGLTLGSTQEFLVRPDALPGLSKAYSLTFKATRGMDPGLVYQAITGNSVDVISVFTTDGRIKASDLVVLDDDKRFFPPYYLTPVIRKKVIDANPKVANALNTLAGKFTEAEMIEINSAIDQEKRSARDVAREILKQKKIIP